MIGKSRLPGQVLVLDGEFGKEKARVVRNPPVQQETWGAYSIFTSGAYSATAPNAAFPQEPGSPAS